jgi:hypothetical protein
MDGWPWAADNDAFSKWDEDKYVAMLDRIAGRKGCLFVTAPDVVGDATKTMVKFYDWVEFIEFCKLPVALVAQDGLKPENVHWNRLACLFIGGTTEWKLGYEARRLIAAAKEHGKWVHVGRVNSYQRARYVRSLGADSIDGTQFSWFRDTKLPGHLNALRQEVISGL